MKYISTAIVSIFILFLLSGCLTCEKKEYLFELKSDGSGKLTITYFNIMSSMEDKVDMTQKDYTELTSDYIEGNKLQEDFPNCKIKKYKLFEKDGLLNGKVTIYFKKLEDVNIYQHQGKGPYMLSLCDFSENYVSSNGSYGDEAMPVVFWEKGLKELKLTTSIDEPGEDNISLIDEHKSFKN
ncbi:MAG: hypothetical protein HOA61_09240 [Bacteroidetes bacterium]|jgi:hypothetical protein|nr:hypothetical protein [Bacteroidota bacterium]